MSGAAQAMNSLQPSFDGINRLSVRSWANVITDAAVSSFRPTSAEGVLASNNQLPPANKPPTSAPTAAVPQQGYPAAQPAYQSQFQQPQQAYPVAQQPASNLGPPPSFAPPKVARARALYPFSGQDDTELTFNANDEVVVIRQGGEWWEGEFRGRRGLFPSNY